MSFRSYFYQVIIFIVIGICLLFTILYFVDPISIWGMEKINGFNHYKIHQREYLDVFKPYEVERIQPNIVWIGSSRVFVGFQMNEMEKEYNMGTSSLTLPDIK